MSSGKVYTAAGTSTSSPLSMSPDATTTPPAAENASKTRVCASEHVLPRLEAGATATFGVEGGNGKGGRFRHVIRLQWVEDGGLRTDDPFGAGLSASGDGNVGYRALNDTKGQGGVGEDGLMSWSDVAAMNSKKYVQVYEAPKARTGGKK